MTERERQEHEARRRAYRQRQARLRRIRRNLKILCGITLAAILCLIGVFCYEHWKDGENTDGKKEPSPEISSTQTPYPTETPSATPSPMPTPTPNTVTMVAVGDNLYDWYMLEDGYQSDGSFSFEGWYDPIKPYLAMADFAVVNQETPLGGDGGYRGSSVEYDYIGSYNRWGSYHGYSTFNTPDEVAEELMAAGFNVVTMATNHASDYGYQALARTVSYWRQFPDVTLLGIHDSAEDQAELRIVEKNGIRLALLNYTYGVNIGSATEEASYSIDILSESRVKSDVAAAKEEADFVVVFVHWGTEYDMTTNAYQEEYTQLFLSCEVDAVIGAHPHIAQPMEWLTSESGHRMVVYYSLGNFISMFKNAKCQLEGMAYLEFYKDGDEKYVKEGTIIPLVNHWNYDASVFGKRRNFTVYALQDYTEALAEEHGCVNYSEGKSFGYAFINELAQNLWGENIKTVDWEAEENE